MAAGGVIPRTIHQVWVGPDPLPDEFAAFVETWRRHHPGWEHRLWTEDEIPTDLRRREALDRLRTPAERSDILRLEILWRFGGVYVDTDFECQGSLEPHLAGAEFVTANLFPNRVNNAFIASVSGHAILDRALDTLEPRRSLAEDIRWAAGPFFFNALIQRSKDLPGVVILPRELVYPRTPDQRRAALAIHHVNRSWKDAAGLREDVLRAERALREAQGRLEEERRAHAETRSRLAAAQERLSAPEALGSRK